MKPIYIALLAILGVVLVFMATFVSVNNTAIGYEETINTSKSGIMTEKQSQHDIVLQQVQAVEASASYEGNVQTQIAKIRGEAQSGNTIQATTDLRVLAEAYPQLQAVGNYSQLMTQMSLSQNLVLQYQTTYNDNVKEYKVFVRRQPFKFFLDLGGYQVQNYQYLEFDNTQLPSNLFQSGNGGQ